MKAGAYDYITKPVNMEELRLVVGRGLEHLDLRQEVRISPLQPRQEVRLREHLGAVEAAALCARYGITAAHATQRC